MSPEASPHRRGRRRKWLVAAILLAVVALAAALGPRRLSPTERALEGTWDFEGRIGGRLVSRIDFNSDGRYTSVIIDPETGLAQTPTDSGRWWVRDNRLILDYAPTRLASWGSGKSGPFAWFVQPLGHDIQSLDEERLTMAPPGSKSETLIRRTSD